MQVRPATLAAATAVVAAEEIRRIVAERCGVYCDLIVTDRKQIERRSPSAVNVCASDRGARSPLDPSDGDTRAAGCNRRLPHVSAPNLVVS